MLPERLRSRARRRAPEHQRLRWAFVFAFSLQIVLMLLSFAVSSVLQTHNTRVMEFGENASLHRLRFQNVSVLSRHIVGEISQTSTSWPYVLGMQRKLNFELAALKQAIVWSGDVDGPFWILERDTEAGISLIWGEILPMLDRFIDRNTSLATADRAELQARFSRVNAVDVVAATSGVVLNGLDRIVAISAEARKRTSDLLYTMNVVINGLSILMIVCVGLLIIRPAIRAQYRAIIRERAVSRKLRTIISELQKSENRAVALYHDAREADRVKAEFLAVVSHELRTPLNAINGFSEIIAKEVHGPHANPKYREYAHDINRSGNHLLDLIDSILDYSRAGAGTLRIKESLINPAETVENVVRLLELEAAAQNVSLETDMDVGPGGRLNGDPRLVLQAVTNVVANAIKFSLDAGHVSLRVELPENGLIRFTVQDQGIGIPDHLIPEIIKPFRQAEEGYVRSNGGVGLGLAITDAIMSAHGGKLEISSTVGQGTTITLLFPADRGVWLGAEVHDVSFGGT